MEEKNTLKSNKFEIVLRNIFVVGFVFYCVCLAVVVADELFSLGIFPTAGEKHINKLIQNFGDTNSNVSERAYNEIITVWSNVAIPQLIKSLSSSNEKIKQTSLKCLKEITQEDFGFDVNLWNDWWKKNKDTF